MTASATGSRRFRDDLVGRTISGVIARPGRNGEPPVVLMLRFEDGSVVEFVSPRSDRLLRQALRRPVSSGGHLDAEPGRKGGAAQLCLDGLMPGFQTREPLAAGA